MGADSLKQSALLPYLCLYHYSGISVGIHLDVPYAIIVVRQRFYITCFIVIP